VYRAFLESFSDGQPLNLSRDTVRFDASAAAVLRCAPSVLLTSALPRAGEASPLEQADFPDTSVRVVDPNVQALVVRMRDPSLAIREAHDLDVAVEAAFDAALLKVSDVRFDLLGQHALMTYSFSCGMLCGSGGTERFDRIRGRWVRSEKSCGDERIS
jgi:hypothetical protein